MQIAIQTQESMIWTQKNTEGTDNELKKIETNKDTTRILKERDKIELEG